MTSSLDAQPIKELIDDCVNQARQLTGRQSQPKVVVSPYRFNPLGAHIDHQGGQVLACCLNQYTVLCFWPARELSSVVYARINNGDWQHTRFLPVETTDEFGWDSMARASCAALFDYSTLETGVEAVVFGTMVSCGLSSSASVILAYLSALAEVNNIDLSSEELVELSRRVENDYRGLNNGIQDQMSIVFGEQKHIVKLDVENVTALAIKDPAQWDQYRFLMCYSGVSRDLGGSPFNTRVAECQQAAEMLYPGAKHLGEVPAEYRDQGMLDGLPKPIGGRARHVFGEMARVEEGAKAWQEGNISRFGQLMNASCQSSIHNYESGSEWLIALHEIARDIPGVHGNRFSGGGYGGCLFMLVDSDKVESIADTLLSKYVERYPDLQGIAKVLIAESESTVRVIQP